MGSEQTDCLDLECDDENSDQVYKNQGTNLQEGANGRRKPETTAWKPSMELKDYTLQKFRALELFIGRRYTTQLARHEELKQYIRGNLEASIIRRFDEVHPKFILLDEKFKALNARTNDDLNKYIENNEPKLDGFARTLEELDTQVRWAVRELERSKAIAEF